LTAINVNAGNTHYCSENGVLFNKDKTTLVCYPVGKTGNNYVIPNSVTTISNHAFWGCGGFTGSLTIPNSVTTIYMYAFADCSGLTDITIGNSVTIIDGYAFSRCRGLTSVTNLNPEPQRINSRVFESVSINTLTLNVPAGSVAAYQAADVWKDFGSIQEGS
jgi:hypothetical protein